MKKGDGSPSPRNKVKIIPRTCRNAVCGGVFLFVEAVIYIAKIS